MGIVSQCFDYDATAENADWNEIKYPSCVNEIRMQVKIDQQTEATGRSWSSARRATCWNGKMKMDMGFSYRQVID
jgi:hypothetical protein